MSDWKTCTLGDIVFINPTERLSKGSTAPKINMDALQPFTKKISGFSCEQYKGGTKFRNGDTLIARITPCLENGKTAYVDILKNDELAFGSTEFIVLREKKEISDKSFLYYFSISPEFRDVAILAMTGSSGRQRVQTNAVASHLFSFPPLPEQRVIGEVLSSLDDKIDLLHRQNKTLEALAETLFRHHFIDNAQDDWEEVSLGESDLCFLIGSGINNFQGEKIYLATADAQEEKIVNKNTKITFENRPSRANMQPVENSVWFAKKGGVRKVLMFASDKNSKQDILELILSTGFSGLKTNDLSHYYVWCYILSLDFQDLKDSLLSGSVQPDINNDGIKSICITRPDNKTLEEFNKEVKPMFKKILSNTKQIQTLEKIRDTLLPKLISGDVRVQYKMGV